MDEGRESVGLRRIGIKSTKRAQEDSYTTWKIKAKWNGRGGGQ
jgi:hypothetical protein